MSTIIRYAFPQSPIHDCIHDFLHESNCNGNSDEPGFTSWPQVDITENENSYMLKADLPGVDKNEISIKIEKGVLSIDGEKKVEKKQQNNKYYYYERDYGKFKRSFLLPEGTDTEKIEANMSNGVLNMTIPKAQKARPIMIEVKE